jgi:hypothetical protein
VRSRSSGRLRSSRCTFARSHCRVVIADHFLQAIALAQQKHEAALAQARKIEAAAAAAAAAAAKAAAVGDAVPSSVATVVIIENQQRATPFK